MTSTNTAALRAEAAAAIMALTDELCRCGHPSCLGPGDMCVPVVDPLDNCEVCGKEYRVWLLPDGASSGVCDDCKISV